MKVKDILKAKGPQVMTIGDEKTVADAREVMVVNNIGALLVLNAEGRMVGIITERDILKAGHEFPDEFRNFPVNKIMTEKLIIAEPEDDIEYVESVMTSNHIRHLPILSEKRLVGMISIGDVVKSLLTQVRDEKKYLYDYISGKVS